MSKKFSISIKKSDTIIYHGTTHEIMPNIYTPGFYSEDISQSIGHILFILVGIRLETLKKPQTPNNIMGPNISRYINNYPVVYKWNIINPIKLLSLDIPYDKSSFSDIFKIDELCNAILELELKKQQNLITRLSKNSSWGNITYNCAFYNRETLQILDSNEKINYGFVDEEPMIYVDGTPKYLFHMKILELYENYNDNLNRIRNVYTLILSEFTLLCKGSCFMGWINSFGYTILSYIDYNKYFRTIDLGNYIEDFDNNYDFDGIYVKEDQNEIILLRNEKNNISLLSIIDTLYLLPYTMKNSPPSDKQKYIEDYYEYVTQYKTIYEKYTQIKNKYDLIYKKRNRLEKPSEEENILKTNTVQFYIECSEAKIKFLEHIYKLIYINDNNDNNESIYDSMFLIDFIQNEEETFDTFNLSKSKNKYILNLSKHFLDIIKNKGDYDEYVVKGAMQANTDEHYTLYKPTNPSIKSFKLALINTHMKDIFKQYIEFIKVTNYYTIYPNEKGSNFKQKYIKYKNKYIKLKSFLL